MTIPVRSPRSADRASFDLRQTFVWFALVGALICGGGLLLKSIVRAAGTQGALGSVALFGAVLVFLGVRGGRRGRAVEQVRTAPDEPEGATGPEDLAEAFGTMDADAFERAVAALCERDGCTEVTVVGGAGDLGADVVAIAPDGRRVVIQCKRYGPVNKVGSQDLQRFGGTCFAVHDADAAAIVTTGEFTRPAEEYAEQCGIVCFDHTALGGWADGTAPAPWDVDRSR